MIDLPDLSASMDIRRSTEVPREALNAFYGEMFPQKARSLIRHWRWMYRVDDQPRVPAPVVAVLDGEVIGQYAQIPVIIGNGEIYKQGVWGVDYGVLDRFRRYGIGYRLMETWLHQHPVHMGFATPASYRIALRQGWSPRLTSLLLQLPLWLQHHARFQHGPWRIGGMFLGHCLHLLARVIIRARSRRWASLEPAVLSPQHLQGWSRLHHPGEPEEPVTVARTPEFLRWRLLDSPFRNQYYSVELSHSDLRAVIRQSGRGGRKALRILSISGHADGPEEIERLLGSIVRWSLDHDIGLVQMVHGDPFVIQVARRWFPHRSALRHVYYCNDDGARRLLDDRPHLWEMLDSDFDLAEDGSTDESSGT